MQVNAPGDRRLEGRVAVVTGAACEAAAERVAAERVAASTSS